MDFQHLKQFDMRTLRYFLVLADELHFGRAAARLNMSQPPLSQQIRQLEVRLGIDLFTRTHHSVELTVAGEALKEQLPFVFFQLEKAINMARLTASGASGRLDIGVISSSLVGVIPTALDMFASRYPLVEWRLHELTPGHQIQGLVERRIDICLFRVPPHQEGLHREIIMQEDLMVAMPRAHPLADRPSISLSQLRDMPFIMFDLQKSRFANFLYQCCVKAGFTPTIRQQIVEVQSLLSLVDANMGVALLPASMQHIAPANVVFKEIKPAAPKIPLYAIYHEQNQSPTLKQFLQIISDLVAATPGKVTSSEADRQVKSVLGAH